MLATRKITSKVNVLKTLNSLMKRQARQSSSGEVQSKSQKIMKSQILEPPIKSKSDKKEYRLICLKNNLKALLIHHENEAENHSESESLDNSKMLQETSDNSEDENDEEEEEREKLAAAGLAINIGSFNDPHDIQGLAHFVEHMIFMGSSKFPNENEFDKYLSSAGGGSNAFTECEHTLFYFDVVEEFLEEAIDRFSSLFVSPLMLRDSMSREIQAVESEFQNNINDDDTRLSQLCASMANPQSPASIFTWGNLKTLIDGDKLYNAAHEFRAKYYVANNMYLTIESSESLDDLQKLVEKYFSDIKSGELQTPTTLLDYGSHFQPDFFNNIFYVKPKGDKCKLFMTFVMPPMQSHYKSKPHDYLAYIIQHEGFGSLSSYLKRNLLALHVSAGSEDNSFDGNSLYTLFGIEILLTEKGYENIELVLQSIFSVLLMLKNTSIEEHEKSYLELKQIRDTSFDFQEEKTSGENTEEYAVNMIYYDSSDIIIGPNKFINFDAEMVKSLIEILNQGKFNLTILTDKHSPMPFIEKWFGTEYDEFALPDSIKKLWADRMPSPEFFMPAPNEFICSNFDILHGHQLENVVPEKVIDENCMELWYKPDFKFLLPHGFINCYLLSPLTAKNARNIVLTSLYSMVVKHYLSEKLYPAVCSGLGYTINAAEKGLLIKLSGYNEKLVLLLEIITRELKEMSSKIEPQVFETYRMQCKRNGYNNIINSKFIAKDFRLSILETQHHLCLEQYKVAQQITFNDLVEFATEFTKELYFKIMVLGNFEKTSALDVAEILQKNLKRSKIVDKNALASRARKIPEGPQNALYVRSFLPQDNNSTITNYYQIGKSTIKSQCLTEFIEKLMNEPLFDILRTKEQFGYSVSCSHRVNNGIIGFTITLQVQEKKHPTIKVNERIEKFLREDFKSILQGLTAEEFEINQISIIKLKMMEEVEMEHENNRLWSEITSNEYIFTRLNLEAEMTKRLTLLEVQKFYDQVLLKAPKFSIQVIGTEEKGCETFDNNNTPVLKLISSKSSENENVVTNIADFRDTLELYDEWKTLIDL